MNLAPDPAGLDTVLVVDDTPANLSLLSNLLNKTYRVQLATSGAKALEIATRTPPDLIVLDVMMPEMDGYETCRRLKADERTRHVPVLFLTALTRPEDEAQGFEVGGGRFHPQTLQPGHRQSPCGHAPAAQGLAGRAARPQCLVAR